MITKNQFGVRQILASKGPAKRNLHDKWCTHGTNLEDMSENDTASGQWFLQTKFELKHTGNFYYVTEFYATVAEATVQANNFDNYQAPNIGGFHYGESFNYILRPNLTLKIPEDQFADWQSAN